jgi:DNA-binding response OmpR family regulator
MEFLAKSMDNPEPRILIVDDEVFIRSALIRALNLLGYFVEGVGSGQEALALLKRKSYDLMVLDMRMPGMSGLQVMQQAREVSPGLLIIILTGHATIDTAIAAVKSEEVVDYLLKPASVHEVAQAVNDALRKRGERREKERLVEAISKAVDDLRRRQGKEMAVNTGRAPERFQRVTPLILDRQKRLVIWDNDPEKTFALTEGEAAVLGCLMARPDEVLSCSQLGRAVWGYEVSESEAQGPIRSIVFRLRRKLETGPDTPRLIHTVRGTGYLFSNS